MPTGRAARPSAPSAVPSKWPSRARSTRSEYFKSGPLPADSSPVSPAEATIDGVRLLSHRPSVLYKVEHLATEPVEGDIAVEGLVLAGPGWGDKLKALLDGLAQ